MSNKYFSYSFQIHRTRKTIIIFILFIVILVGGFFLFYRSKQHLEQINRLGYEVVLGMNEFEDNSCKKAYRMSYQNSTCGTICINVSKSDPDFLKNTKLNLEKTGFVVGDIHSKQINKNTWNYFSTKKVDPIIHYYAIDYGNDLYNIELIDQSGYLKKTKQEECRKSFNKVINSIKLK